MSIRPWTIKVPGMFLCEYLGILNDAVGAWAPSVASGHGHCLKPHTWDHPTGRWSFGSTLQTRRRVRDKTFAQMGPTYRLLKPSTLEHGKLDIVRRAGWAGVLLVHRKPSGDLRTTHVEPLRASGLLHRDDRPTYHHRDKPDKILIGQSRQLF